MTYPTVAQIEAKLTALDTDAQTGPLCTRTAMGASRLGTVTSVLKIFKGGGANRVGVVIIAGMHAREWAPPAAVLELVELILKAYAGNKALTVGGYTAPKAKIKAMVDKLDIYVAPMLNPDGYSFSRNHGGSAAKADWRKNRAPAPGVLPGGCTAANAIGVDLNRNFDIVWDYDIFYSTNAISTGDLVSSKNPCRDIFIGSGAFSEPETVNVRNLLNNNPQFFVDVHMKGGTILHSWGIEANGTDPAMRFNNSAFDRKANGTGGRDGPKTLVYNEFLDTTVLSEITLIAARMAAAIKKASGAVYTPQPGVVLYATSGASDDFAFSRHITDPTKPRTFAYTLECGSDAEGGFFPDWATQYPKIAKEVQAALLALLTYAADWTPPPPAPAPPPGGGGGGGGGGGAPAPEPPLERDCVIATAVYGSREDPAVRFLLHLRDRELAGSAAGKQARRLVNWLYYSVSPALARFLAPRVPLRRVVRTAGLDPVVRTLRVVERRVARLPSPVARSAVWVALLTLGLVGGVAVLALAGSALVTLLVEGLR